MLYNDLDNHDSVRPTAADGQQASHARRFSKQDVENATSWLPYIPVQHRVIFRDAHYYAPRTHDRVLFVLQYAR